MSLKDKLEPNGYYERAESALELVTVEDRRSWLTHPCTIALRARLEGDLMGILSLWVAGAYSDDSAEADQQKNAKARGMLQAVDDVLDAIDNIAKGEVSD